jgi:plastocyanin
MRSTKKRLLTMRVLFVAALLSSVATLIPVAGPAQACDELLNTSFYSAPMYSVPMSFTAMHAPVSYSTPMHAAPVHSTRVVYYPSCVQTYYAPQVYYAPPMHSQRQYGSQPSYSQRRAPARPTTTITVQAYDNYFEPKTINAQPGTTIRWVNRGEHEHTVTSNDGRWDSGDIKPGAAYSATFRHPGTYRYYCRHHTDDKMQGTIVIGRSSNGGGDRARSSGY